MTEVDKDLLRLKEDLVKAISELNLLKNIAIEVFSSKNATAVFKIMEKFFKEMWSVESVRVLKYMDDNFADIYKSGERGGNPVDSLARWALNNSKPMIVPVNGSSSVLYMPLAIREKKLGVVTFSVRLPAERFDSNAIEIVTVISYYISSYLLNNELLEESRETADYLTNIFESLPNGFITLDRGRNVQFVNRNAMFLLDLDDTIIGKKTSEALPDELKNQVTGLIEAISKEGYGEELVLSRKSKLGIELHFAVSCNILRTGTAIEGYVLVFRDMTASKELERLRDLDRLKDAFVSNVSHELKTPLTSIRAYTEALSDMVQDDTQKDFLNVIMEESDRLLNLINELLSVQRIQSGRIKVNYQDFVVNGLISDVIKLMEKQSDKHTIKFECDGDVSLQADYNLLKEVMLNLVSNAIKYSPSGGDVNIRMNLKEENVIVSVADQGMGISEEHQKKIFEPFYRVDSSLTNTISGTGLGLPIVKSIIEAHGGKVEIKSEAGKGSTFTVALPQTKIA